MPFGLSNAPSTWQRVINDTIFEGLGSFCCAYVVDIIIWSPSVEQHGRDVRTVLQRQQEEGLSINVEKCEFDVKGPRYLGHILSASGIRPDPRKVQALLDWPVPKTTKEVHQFHGLGTYYRGYLEGFARIAKPLTELMKNDAPFLWSPACQEALNGLRSTLASAVMHHHFDPSLPTTVTRDAADGCLGAAMYQARLVGSSHPRPVACMSKTMIPADLNYFIHDKELLAIVRALEELEPELLSLQEPLLVVTDHRALEYFMTKQKVNARQARWAEYLSQFNFRITYRPGCKNRAADPLSRRSPRTDHEEVPNVTLLPRGLFTSKALADLDAAVVAACGDEIDDEVDDEEDDDEDGRDPILELEVANRGDTEEMTKLGELARDGSPGYSVDSRSLQHISDKVYVPADSLTLAALLIRHVHKQPSTGHLGRNRMVCLLSTSFHLKNLAKRVAKYLKNCPVCCKLARHTSPPPLLRPLPVPDSPWRDISVDFVGPLPMSDGFNMIMVVVDRLTKMRHYIPCTAKEVDSGKSAPAMARLFLDHVFRLHGLPDTIVSDRLSQFSSAFWEHLMPSLGIKRKLSTAYHPQTNEQTERTNQDLENYLRRCVSWRKDDWARVASQWQSSQLTQPPRQPPVSRLSTQFMGMNLLWTLTSPRANRDPRLTTRASTTPGAKRRPWRRH